MLVPTWCWGTSTFGHSSSTKQSLFPDCFMESFRDYNTFLIFLLQSAKFQASRTTASLVWGWGTEFLEKNNFLGICVCYALCGGHNSRQGVGENGWNTFDYLCISSLQVSGECMLTVIAISTRAHANVTALEAVELMVRVLAEDVFIRTLPLFVHHLRQLQQTHNSLFVSLAN